ncbi:MAG: threonylcarbamoyl-AMP synthase, partial [Candidatus Eisenbacteria bacterium]|nr:threonylcarbamoyl-AMP synthase [Candidatus Latescibacterota bacterium]MBD3302191.1 threonylcarbamoyl-AMP synthase [Candidatus Eisenbacteria bacterium]
TVKNGKERSQEREGGGTRVFRLGRLGPSIRVVRALVPILRDGGVVLLPTDTIYGFSARFDLEPPRRRILDLKGDHRLGAMLSLVSGFEMAFRYVEPPHGPCKELLLRHWPGPLTAVLRARSHVPTDHCGPGDTIAFRWPISPFLQALLGAVGVPLLSTSANRSGEATPSRFEELLPRYDGKLEAIVDGGELVGEASTVVDLTGKEPVLIRPGAVEI